MIQMPQVNFKVFYFLQGYAEHTQIAINVISTPSLRVSPRNPCRVASVKFMADPETDEVLAKIKLVPLKSSKLDQNDSVLEGEVVVENQEKSTSLTKTLTQSDANTGGVSQSLVTVQKPSPPARATGSNGGDKRCSW
ncbi:hypothetical protein PIB30_001159 [Stylosanthes scabra]|uniref:Uncharacterized protein n=1 Tax=Stylosanthes scabra TaxID=79078 RepID=A0ABU6V4K3_9FABA|nr:hypothetical protein [Stylosanthes scabra]